VRSHPRKTATLERWWPSPQQADRGHAGLDEAAIEVTHVVLAALHDIRGLDIVSRTL
jgi:hypothetical protein